MAELLKLPTSCETLAEWQRCYTAAPPSLNTLRRAFTALTRWAFSEHTNKGGFAEELGCLVWTNGPDSELTISPASIVDPGDTEHVPGVTVSCSQEGVTYDRLGLSATVQESPDTALHFREYTAQTKLQFVCSAFDADTACIMADYLMLFLTAIEQKLKETFSWLLEYKPQVQTEPKLSQQSQAENSMKWYEATVIFDLAYLYSVTVARESKRLKDFSVEADLTADK